MKVGLINLLSRISGFLREVFKTALLGTSAAGDAFQIAFTLPNTLRIIAAEGTLMSVFLPIFAESYQKSGRETAKRFFISLFFITLFVLGIISILFIFNADFVMSNVLAVGLKGEALTQAIFLSRIMFSYIILIAAASLIQGVLNYHGHFVIPLTTQILLNIIIVLCGILAFYQQSDIAMFMAIGVLIGGSLQLIIPLIMISKKGYLKLKALRPEIANERPEKVYLSKMLKNFGPGAFGSSIHQIDILISNAIATSLVSGSVVALNLSIRLLDTIVSIFVNSQTIVLLPMISKRINENRVDEAQILINQSLALASFLTIPLMFVLFSSADLIINVLFLRGAFDERSAQLTISALVYHLPGILFFGANRIMITCYHAQKMFKLIAYFSLITVITNTTLAYGLSKTMSISGIALANTVSQMVYFCLMAIFISHKTNIEINWQLIIKKSFSKHLFAGLVMFGGIYMYSSLEIFSGVLELFITLLLGGILYLAVNLLLKSDEIRYIFSEALSKKTLKDQP